MAKSNDKMVANNKKAYHDYFILDKIETGIALHGTEVKSLRMGKCSIKESFIRIENGEVFVFDASTNGTFLNDMRLPKLTKSPIHSSDKITFADVSFEVHYANR